MFPAQALAEAMLRKGWRVKLTTDSRGARYTGGFPAAVTVEERASATFARGGLVAKLVAPLKIVGGTLQSVLAMLRDRPAVVVGFGGYPAIPAMAASTALRLPRMIHEQNGILGRVNALFAKHVDMIACGTWPTDLPDGVQGEPTGNPVRKAVHDRAGAPYIPPGDWPMSVLVMGGSQGARILSDVVPTALSSLPEDLRTRLRVSHQARPEDITRVEKAYAGADISADVLSFFTDVPARMSEAQLVITRAGASSVADLTVIGRPAILVPFAAAAGDHQTANARGLVEAGAAILMPESKFDPATLSEHVAMILTQPEAAVKMAHAALSVGHPDATDRLVDLVEQLAYFPKGSK